MRPDAAYALFCLLMGVGLGSHATIYAPFLDSIGVTLSGMAVVNAFFWVTGALLELPTGMLADGKSRIWSVRIGTAVVMATGCAYAFADGLVSAIVIESLMAVGFAFQSGAESAWLTDALKRKGEDAFLRRAFGTAALSRSAGFLIGGVMGAGVASLGGLRAPWLVGTVFLAGAVLVSFRLMNDDGEPEKRMTEKAAFCASHRMLRKTPALIWAASAAMLFGLVLPFNHYWSLFFRGQVGQAGLGWLWIPLYGSCVVAGWLVRKSTIPAGKESGGILLGFALAGIGMATIGFMPVLPAAVLMVIVHQVGRGIFLPFLEVFVQHRVESGYRATYGSLQALLAKAGYGTILIAVWIASHDLPSRPSTVVAVWAVCGSLLILSGGVLWFLRPKR
jgi:MFS family permease